MSTPRRCAQAGQERGLTLLALQGAHAGRSVCERTGELAAESPAWAAWSSSIPAAWPRWDSPGGGPGAPG